MKTVKQYQYTRMCVVLAIAAIMALGSGLAMAGYDQDSQRGQNESSYQTDRSDQSSAQDQSQPRDMRLEQQIAGALRQQGYGTRGEIMILATGNRVILLGTVPSRDQKSGAEQITKGIARGKSIDNRLHVNAQARQMPDSQLEKSITDNLRGDIRDSVQVSVQNGTATLQGQVDSWKQVADAIDAAFAAGARQVNSQFTVGSDSTMAQGGAGGYPAYGYTPGQQGQYSQQGQYGQQGQAYDRSRSQQGAMGGQAQANPADLRLAQQVANQLRQQLPPGQNVQLVQPQSIYVTVRQGIVTLTGYVPSSSQKQQAQQIVQSIRGVQNVTNNITILSTSGTAGQPGQGGQGGWQGQGNQGQGGWQGQGNQSQGGQSSQGGYYAPQGYIPGQSAQDQYGQSSQMGGQQGSTSQDQFGQSSQYGQSSQMGGQQGSTGQDQFGQSGQMGGQQDSTSQDQYGQGGQYGQSGQTGGRQGGMSASDISLAQQIVQKLRQQLPNIRNIQAARPGTIYVMAARGNVILHGLITDPSVKQQASQIANAVPGVQNVTDRLRVIGAGTYPSYGYIPGQSGQDTSGQSDQGARTQLIGQGGQSGQMGSSQSDMALAQQVAQKLRQQLTGVQNVQIERPGTIYVKVANGTVTLDGFVSDNNTKQKAEQVAKSISGVQTVKNTLSIGAGTGADQAFGYIPPEDESQSQQFGNQQFGNQQFGNQQFGNQQSEDQEDEQPDENTN